MRSAICLALCVIFFARSAAAEETAKEKNLGIFGGWHAYSYDEGGQIVCYMVTTKTLKSSGPSKRIQPYLMVTHRPIEASIDVVSYGAGVLINAKYGVKINTGKTIFDLFAVRDTAWARDAQTDHKLARALRNQTSALITSHPEKKGSRAIKDQFDLTGASAAYRAIGKACGLPDDTPQKRVITKSTSHKK